VSGKSRPAEAIVATLEIAPHSQYAQEFARMSKKHGAARLCVDAKHPNAAYALVEFGDSGLHRRAYEAQELRLLSVA
jgi:hypothetical protein